MIKVLYQEENTFYWGLKVHPRQSTAFFPCIDGFSVGKHTLFPSFT